MLKKSRLVPGSVLTVVCLLAISTQPAGAACDAQRSFWLGGVRTPGVADCTKSIECCWWDSGVDFIPGEDCFTQNGLCDGPSVSSSFVGAFWAVGTGDPLWGLGDDNGAWPVSEWLFPLPGPLALCTTLSGDLGSVEPLGVYGNWSAAAVDGCVDRAGTSPFLDGDECMALLLSDRFEDQGYFLFSTERVSGVNFDFGWSWEPQVLIPIPAPAVSNVIEPSPLSHTVELIVTAPSLAESEPGLRLDSECGGSPVLGYHLYRVVPPKHNRISGEADLDADPTWTRITTEPLPPGESAEIEIDCGFFGSDVLLAGTLVFDGGFETAHKSQTVGPFSCKSGSLWPLGQP